MSVEEHLIQLDQLLSAWALYDPARRDNIEAYRHAVRTGEVERNAFLYEIYFSEAPPQTVQEAINVVKVQLSRLLAKDAASKSTVARS